MATMVMVEQTLDQLAEAGRITHVVMQGGLGSIAAAIFLGFQKRYADDPPRMVVVEPNEADCLYQTAAAAQPTRAVGSLHTIMAGLACREVSPATWKVLVGQRLRHHPRPARRRRNDLPRPF